MRFLCWKFDIRHDLHSFGIAVAMDDVDLVRLMSSLEQFILVFAHTSNSIQQEWQNMNGRKCSIIMQ